LAGEAKADQGRDATIKIENQARKEQVSSSSSFFSYKTILTSMLSVFL
jgi:hypothetical protein